MNTESTVGAILVAIAITAICAAPAGAGNGTIPPMPPPEITMPLPLATPAAPEKPVLDRVWLPWVGKDNAE